MRTIKVLFCAALASAALASTTAAQAAPGVRYRPHATGINGESVAINNRGDLLVRLNNADIGHFAQVRHRDGSVVDLDGEYGFGRDLNDSGTVAGSLSRRGMPSAPALWDSHGHHTLLPTAPGATEDASALNDRGDVVGYSSTLGDDGVPVQRAIEWVHGVRKVIGPEGSLAIDIDNRGVISGVVGTGADAVGVVFDGRGGYRPIAVLPGSSQCSQSHLNDRGAAVGLCDFPATGSAPVYWDRAGAPHALPELAGFGSTAPTGINDRGVISAEAQRSRGDQADHVGVAYPSPTAAPVRLPSLLRDPGPSDYYSDETAGVNDRGVIAGTSSPRPSVPFDALVWTPA